MLRDTGFRLHSKRETGFSLEQSPCCGTHTQSSFKKFSLFAERFAPALPNPKAGPRRGWEAKFFGPPREPSPSGPIWRGAVRPVTAFVFLFAFLPRPFWARVFSTRGLLPCPGISVFAETAAPLSSQKAAPFTLFRCVSSAMLFSARAGLSQDLRRCHPARVDRHSALRCSFYRFAG